tara:strand:+ start:1222 stop:1671 length:450 start_codon:yes stop_codon:yes gene_type:complete
MAKSSEEEKYDYGASITAQSTPDYDSFGVDDYWTCNDWMIWHTRLKAEYGLTTANEIWMTAWNEQGAFESNYNWCKYNCTFAAFADRNNLPVKNIFSRLTCGVVDVSSNIADGFTTGAKVVRVAIPLAVIGVGIFYAFKAYKILKGGRR